MPNTSLEKIEYKIEETAMGTWMRYGYENGTSFHEFKSFPVIMKFYVLKLPAAGDILSAGMLGSPVCKCIQIKCTLQKSVLNT